MFFCSQQLKDQLSSLEVWPRHFIMTRRELQCLSAVKLKSICNLGYRKKFHGRLRLGENNAHCSVRSRRFRRAFRSRRFSIFGGAKIGVSTTLTEAVGRGRGGEKRKRLPANPMILKNAPLTLLQLDKFTV